MKNAQSSWTPHSVHAPADNDNADDDEAWIYELWAIIASRSENGLTQHS